MKYLITGGCGFIGSNLAAEVLKRGEELFVLDNLFRYGSSSNLEWLRTKGDFTYYPYDTRNTNDVETVIKEVQPDYIFHLAGQVAMTTSISNPRLDYETNALGTFNLLDAVRKYSPDSVILYSSTNKVYGDFEYYRIYGLKTIVFRHSSMYGSNQHATYDQGWIGWFCQKALEIKNHTLQKPFTISGTGKQVRDVLHGEDVVNLYFTAKDIDKAYGEVFNIGGGIENSLSLLELFDLLENKLDIEMTYTQLPWRESDQKVFVADIEKATRILGWLPKVSKESGVELMINWLSL